MIVDVILSILKYIQRLTFESEESDLFLCFLSFSDVVGEQKSESGRVRGAKCWGFSPWIPGF